MRNRLTKLILLLVLTICLPLQGLAAISMASCQAHDTQLEMQINANATDNMDHCKNHRQNDSDHHSSKKSSCDKCITCYLSVAQAIIPFHASFDLGATNATFTTVVLAKLNPVPSPHFHPPRTTLA